MSKQFLQTTSLPHAHPTDIFSLALTPTHLLSASGSSSLKIHSIATKTGYSQSPEDADDTNPYPLVQTLERVHPLGCHHICASADGRTAASAGFGGEVKVWSCTEGADDAAGSCVLKGEVGAAVKEKAKKKEHYWALSLSPDGRFLACTTHDGKICIYDTLPLTSGGEASLFATYETKGSFALAVDISPDAAGSMTASGHANGSIYLFANSTQRLAHSLSGLVKPVRSVKFSPACRYLAAAGDARVIALYDTQSGEQVAHFTGHASWIMSLDWNWSGEYIVSCGYDGKAKVWSFERRECVATQAMDEKCLWAVKWLPGGPGVGRRNETFVTGGAGKALAFYREASGT